ncbi:Methyltransferase domain-containing protein [Streptomyces sp. TLI_053]|uniref:class I SAM-dependent methyltransferase n=1 Tax=Streptomyces sp. TLI_053 TaxID=1855352 RepID=UPI00087D3015|nr:class I SAM-dependent methyltransferase [Streptomyces sp. TLI_053]SDS81456.1 Methyltransferase domain-containing protein [Streptomyces sp. TLI_053]
MTVTSRYLGAWEGFWRDAPAEPGAVIWDAEAALVAECHLALFRPELVDPDLPLVDLGCGSGTQTRFLAGRFGRVLGVDLSQAAVELARRNDPAGAAEYARLDATDAEAVRALHERLGDVNLYLRGVIHQSDPADRGPVAEAVAVLAGRRGRAFVVELAEAAKRVLADLAAGPAGPPPKLRPVFDHGLAPAEVADGAFVDLFGAAGLTVLGSGDLPLATTEFTAAGARIELPARWLLVGADEGAAGGA